MVGLQRSLVFVIFNECKINRTKITNPISIEYLAKACNSNVFSIKKSIQRLEKKGIIFRAEFKNGRSGWTKYELTENVYKEIIINHSNSKFDENWRQTGDKLGTELETKLRTIFPSSNSTYKTTTTIQEGNSQKNDNVWNLDITPLTTIGFTQKHLEQISQRTSHSPEEVQEAIYAFSYDLENKKIKIRNGNDPLHFFMGIMGKGGLYLPTSADYMNPTLRASKLYLEKRKERKDHYQQVESALRNENFEQWNSQLNEEEKERILPEEVKNSGFKPYIQSSLLAYHRKNLWPEKRLSFYEEKGIPIVDFNLLEAESEEQ